jgi:hypothetical protein
MIGEFRSSDLWDDTRDTIAAENPEPLDLLLFNRSQGAWGAHVAVFLGDSQAIHLSKQIRRPVIWTLTQFAVNPLYRCFIGAKRVKTVIA